MPLDGGDDALAPHVELEGLAVEPLLE